MRIALRLSLFFLCCLAALQPAAAQAWRTAAEQRIEQHRKGTFSIVVRDDAGAPVPNATVHVQMQRHAFGFGTAIQANLVASDETYRNKIANVTGDGRTFNLAVFGNDMKWPFWENNSAKTLLTNRVLWLQSRGMDVRGHTLLWPGVQSWQTPTDVVNNLTRPDYVVERVEEHIRNIVGYRGMKGEIREWDVVNEPAHLFAFRDALRGSPGYPTGEEIYAQAFQWAAEADPAARLYINEYNIIAHYASQASVRQRYKSVIQRILDAGAPLHGIGMQGHISPDDPTRPEDIYRALEEFAVFGKELAVTEYDYARSSNPSNQGANCRKADETVAGQYMRDFLTVVFSHPLVKSFTMWGFWDGDHWRCDAAMFRPDWTLKPSGQAFLDLVFDEWWTDETVTTDAQGEAVVRGFLGEYELTADVAGGAITRSVDLTSTGTTRVVLSRTTTAAEPAPGVPGALVLAPNYPNPFNPATVIGYGLPAPAHVRLDVYDALGRKVGRLVDAQQGAGWHEAFFTADDLPGGVYFYRLTAGTDTRTGQMLLAK